jgi:predicted lipoprotein with Yx(FWY)xxD motif
MRRIPLTMWCSAALALGLAGCNADRTDDTLTDATPDVAGEPATVDPATPPGAMPPADTGATTEAANLTVATGSAGSYLADNSGRALYMLEGDTDGSKCTEGCLEVWPPLLAPQGAPTATAPNLKAEMLGTTKRADGSTQVTYNGHPLYRYTQDTGPGSTAGQGIDDDWGEWYLVSPEGTAMEAESAPAAAEPGT